MFHDVNEPKKVPDIFIFFYPFVRINIVDYWKVTRNVKILAANITKNVRHFKILMIQRII